MRRHHGGRAPFGASLALAIGLLGTALQAAAQSSWDAAPEDGALGVPNADLSSPRAVLLSLFKLSSEFRRLVHETGFTAGNFGRLESIGQQNVKLFDLREVAPSFRRDFAGETAVYLRDALARVPLPAIEEVPGEDEMAARISDGKAPFYRVPGTPVVIRRIDAGVYDGRYQFSSATMEEARAWHMAIRSYPYQEGQAHIAGVYENYFLTPGPLIPLDLIRGLPEWMQKDYLEQAVWQWALFVVTALALPGLYALLWLVVGRAARRAGQLVRNVVLLAKPLGIIALTMGAREFLDEQVFLTGQVLKDVQFAARLIVLLATVVLILQLGNVLTEAILTARHLKRRRIDSQLVRLGMRMLSVLVAVVVVIEGMHDIGFSLATMVAGAGVTGLAIALAAQDTLKNVFGGLMLALDRPFEVGQRVRIKSHDGIVEDVGLRSTKIRTLVGHQISIPNEDAARLEIENVERRPYVRRDLNIAITYDTPPEKIARAVGILREIFSIPEASAGGGETGPHPNEAVNRPGYPPRIYFSELAADSLNLLVVYWFHPPDHWLAMEFAHRVNMEIVERFNAESIEFAFPTQTVHLARDERLPTTEVDGSAASAAQGPRPLASLTPLADGETASDALGAASGHQLHGEAEGSTR